MFLPCLTSSHSVITCYVKLSITNQDPSLIHKLCVIYHWNITQYQILEAISRKSLPHTKGCKQHYHLLAALLLTQHFGQVRGNTSLLVTLDSIITLCINLVVSGDHLVWLHDNMYSFHLMATLVDNRPCCDLCY